MSESAAVESVLAFLNTADLAAAEETLTSPAALARWLAARNLVPEATPVEPRDLASALELREALRELAVANNGGPVGDPPPDLRRALGSVRLRADVDDNGNIVLEPVGRPIQQGLGRLVVATIRAASNGSWHRVKACRNDECRWVFLDSSRNRSRTWCAMSVCGARAKSRAYQRRLRLVQQEAG